MRTHKSFIDTNIWVYAFLAAEGEEEKKSKITSFLEDLKTRSEILTSVQVLNEFHWILKRKYKVDESIIRNKVTDGILQVASVISLDLESYKNAYGIRDSYNISFWDSIIVASALKSECKFFYTEDMQHRQKIEKKLEIVNPLL